MVKTGIIHEDERVELLDGEIIEMAAIGSRHFACVNRYNRLFNMQVGDRAIVSIQNPFHLSTYSEPEPDVVLFRPRADDYAAALPDPDDVLLIVEVSDTTLAYDRDRKLPRYAEAGIPELWITELRRELVTAYREPEGRRYRRAVVYRRGDVLTPAALPDVAIAVNAILPDPEPRTAAAPGP
jgi:Uma2 family endonuclease